jgi:hypothetical protein
MSLIEGVETVCQQNFLQVALRVGVIWAVVAGVIVAGGSFLPGDLPHNDTPDTLPGPGTAITQTLSSGTLSPIQLQKWR